jgi:hypothetical protein
MYNGVSMSAQMAQSAMAGEMANGVMSGENGVA